MNSQKMLSKSVLRMLLKFVVVTCVSIFSLSSVSADTATENVRLTVETSVNSLVARLEEKRPLYKENTEEFYREMGGALSELVDFRRIAARVMGKYGRSASVEQRDRFVETFKRSLFTTYSKALVESGKFTVQVQQANMLSPEQDKASVDIEVTAENGNKYKVVYSMYLNTSKNAWLLENIIVSGINVGLAFRDRFEQEMRTNRGDMDAVIANWNSQLDIEANSQG